MWCARGATSASAGWRRRFDAFEHADQVTVTYRSFQLDPSSPATSELSLEQMLAHEVRPKHRSRPGR